MLKASMYQYMGQLNFGGWLVFDYYLAARDENDKAADVVLDFDAENNKFTTNQVVVLHESPEQWYPYQTFTEVAFTKYVEAAATPVDPTMDRVVLKGKYPYIRCTIPATGTNDEALNGLRRTVSRCPTPSLPDATQPRRI